MRLLCSPNAATRPQSKATIIVVLNANFERNAKSTLVWDMIFAAELKVAQASIGIVPRRVDK
jgi:hypothetical protein